MVRIARDVQGAIEKCAGFGGNRRTESGPGTAQVEVEQEHPSQEPRVAYRLHEHSFGSAMTERETRL
jgi:hypothetical protein